MGFQKNKDLEFVYEYDFDVDGGAAGAIALRPTGNAMLSGLYVRQIDIVIETAFDDAANSATCTLGPTGGDADGYFADFMTLAETVDTVIRTGEVAGDLMWDDTNDHEINYRLSSDALAVPSMTVAVEALTQGKAKFIFKCRNY